MAFWWRGWGARARQTAPTWLSSRVRRDPTATPALPHARG